MLLRRELLKATLPATTEYAHRCKLNALQLHPDGRVVATDAHVLLVATDAAAIPEEDFPALPDAPALTPLAGPVLLPASAAVRLINGTAKRNTIRVLQTIRVGQSGDGALAASTDLNVPTIVRIPASEPSAFPNWERVLPATDRPAVKVTLAVDVLQTLIKSAKAIGARTVMFSVPTTPPDGQEGVVLDALGVSMRQDGLSITGCAMPCRV